MSINYLSISIYIGTCQLKTEAKKLQSGNCVSVETVNVTYCSGSCGDSRSEPILMTADVIDGLLSDCKCCTGVVKQKNKIKVICDGTTYKDAYYYEFSRCECDKCINTGLY